MAELVDAHDSKSCSFGSEGSSPSLVTMKIYEFDKNFFLTNKHQLDGLVFWRESMDETVYVKLAAPYPGLVPFVKKFSLRVIDESEIKLKSLNKES